MAEKLSLASVILLIASAVFLLLAFFFFLLFNIPSVISDLSGRTAKRSISKLRAANEKSSSKFYGSSQRNKERGKLTDNIATPENKDVETKSDRKNRFGRKKELVFSSGDDRPETGLLNENRVTGVSASQATTALTAEDGTDELFPTGQSEGATTDLLGEVTGVRVPVKRSGGIKLSILDEVIMVHTDEVIM